MRFVVKMDPVHLETLVNLPFVDDVRVLKEVKHSPPTAVQSVPTAPVQPVPAAPREQKPKRGRKLGAFNPNSQKGVALKTLMEYADWITATDLRLLAFPDGGISHGGFSSLMSDLTHKNFVDVRTGGRSWYYRANQNGVSALGRMLPKPKKTMKSFEELRAAFPVQK